MTWVTSTERLFEHFKHIHAEAYHCKEVFILCDERDIVPLVMVDQSLVDIGNVHHGLQQLEIAPESAAVSQFG